MVRSISCCLIKQSNPIQSTALCTKNTNAYDDHLLDDSQKLLFATNDIASIFVEFQRGCVLVTSSFSASYSHERALRRGPRPFLLSSGFSNGVRMAEFYLTFNFGTTKIPTSFINDARFLLLRGAKRRGSYRLLQLRHKRGREHTQCVACTWPYDGPFFLNSKNTWYKGPWLCLPGYWRIWVRGTDLSRTP